MCEKGENPFRMVDHDKLVQQGERDKMVQRDIAEGAIHRCRKGASNLR